MISLNASWFWAEEKGTGELCSFCQEPIFTKMFYPVMQIDSADKLNFSDIDLKLCQSCKELHDKPLA